MIRKDKRLYECPHCKHKSRHPILELIFTPVMGNYHYFKCRKCGRSGWHYRKPLLEFVPCYKCLFRNECETADRRDGCVLGEFE
jgi:ribosomal protein L37E